MSRTRISDRKFFREGANRARHHAEVGVKTSHQPVAVVSEPSIEIEDRVQAIAAEQEDTGPLFEGQIAFFNPEVGWGFICFSYPDGTADDIFVHISSVQPWQDGVTYPPVVGCEVRFREGWDRGRRLAVDVEILSWPELSIEEQFLAAEELPIDEPAAPVPASESTVTCLQPEYRSKTLRDLVKILPKAAV